MILLHAHKPIGFHIILVYADTTIDCHIILVHVGQSSFNTSSWYMHVNHRFTV